MYIIEVDFSTVADKYFSWMNKINVITILKARTRLITFKNSKEISSKFTSVELRQILVYKCFWCHSRVQSPRPLCSNNSWNSSGPTWWPQSFGHFAHFAPAAPASQTDRGRVPPQPGTTLGSGPGRGAAPWSPTRTAGCGGRSRGGWENWSCPLAPSDLLHTLTITQYQLRCTTTKRFTCTCVWISHVFQAVGSWRVAVQPYCPAGCYFRGLWAKRGALYLRRPAGLEDVWTLTVPPLPDH